MSATTKITGLTVFNVNAIREAVELEPEPIYTAEANVYLTATTAEWVGLQPAEVITWLDAAMRAMPTKGHPRASLHAVRRKLAKLVPAHEPLKAPLPGRAHVIDNEGRTRDAHTGEELEL